MFSNPVAQFLVAAALVVGGVALATDVLAHRAAEDEAVADARATTELLAHSVAEPLIPARLAAGNLEAALAFDRVARERIMVDDVTRVKIWNEDGRVVYSDERSLIGDRFELGDGAREVLASGSSDAGVSDLRSPENRYELEAGGLLEVYTRIESPEGDPLLFEVYYSADRMREATEDIFAGFRPITVGGLVVLGLLTTPLLWMLSRRLERAAKARERLLRNAVAASAGERRRIAQDQRREARNLVLKVADNGVGFVPGAFSGADRLGLRAVTDLAAEAGGRLDVQSRPGRGTVVRLVTPG